MQELVRAVQAARLVHDAETLKAIEANLRAASGLSAAQKETIRKLIARTRQALPEKPAPADAALRKLQAASRDWTIPGTGVTVGGDGVKVGGEAGKLGGDVSNFVKQGENAAAQYDPTQALRREWENARAAAMKDLPRLSPQLVFDGVQGALQQRIEDELRKNGVLYNPNTGDIDLRSTRMGQVLSRWAYDFAQGNRRQGGVQQFTYNVKSQLLTLRLYARHRQSWGKVIPGMGPVDLYDVTQTAAFWYSFRKGSGGFDIDLGPLAPHVNSETLAKLEAGDLVGAAEAAAPGVGGMLLHHEQTDEYAQLLAQYQARWGAANVYFASKTFVDWAGPDTFARYVLNGVITAGASVYPQIMHDAEQQAQNEFPRLIAWLEGRGMSNAEAAARQLLTGQQPPWPFMEFEIIPVQYASRDRPLGAVSTPWIRENHLAFVIIWTTGGHPANPSGAGGVHTAGYETRQREQAALEERQHELALERQRALQQERQHELALERQRELAAERQRELAAERQRELALERQRALQEERQRELALERQRELAAERQRELMAERQRELAIERQRELALERQRELAAERQRVMQEERQRELAAERQRRWPVQPR